MDSPRSSASTIRGQLGLEPAEQDCTLGYIESFVWQQADGRRRFGLAQHPVHERDVGIGFDDVVHGSSLADTRNRALGST
jgi:hypothetical protein